MDDNGTFVCRAENKAGAAAARFTLHVVVPMPPKPPQVKKRDRESKKVASHFPPYYRRVLLRLRAHTEIEEESGLNSNSKTSSSFSRAAAVCVLRA